MCLSGSRSPCLVAVAVFNTELEFLRSFGSAGSGPGCLGSVYGLTAHLGCLYVADCSNSRIHCFSDDGEFLRSIGGVCNPRGVAVVPLPCAGRRAAEVGAAAQAGVAQASVAHGGFLIVAERVRAQVLALPSGERLQVLVIPGARSLWGVVGDPDEGNLYVADAGTPKRGICVCVEDVALHAFRLTRRGYLAWAG